MLSLLPESIRNKIYPEPNTGCWIWGGALSGKNGNQYGNVRFNGKSRRVHRVVYELLVGPIPDGLDLDHLCRMGVCSNPQHLEAVTTKINVARGIGNPNQYKTHCKRGHAFTPENTYTFRRMRHCRACNRTRALQWYYKHKT